MEVKIFSHITGIDSETSYGRYAHNFLETTLDTPAGRGSQIVSLWSEAGLCTTDPSEDPGTWRNVVRHQLAQSMFAAALADGMHLPDEQRATLITATAIEDWHMRFDRERAEDKKSEIQARFKWEFPQEIWEAVSGTDERTIVGTLASEGPSPNWVRRLTHWIDNLFQEDEMMGWRGRVARERVRRADLDTDPELLSLLKSSGAPDATYWDAEERLSGETEQHVFSALREQSAGSDLHSPNQVADYIWGKVQSAVQRT